MNWQKLAAIISIVVLLIGSAYGATKVVQKELNTHYVKKTDYQVFAMNLHIQLLDQRSSVNARELHYMRKTRKAFKGTDPTQWDDYEEERYKGLMDDQKWIKLEKVKRMKSIQ
jgi:hypothetical protein